MKGRMISNLLRNQDSKTIVSNLGYLSLLETSTHLFPLITTPYLARVVGVDGFGAIAVGLAIIAYFQIITNYSFVYTAVRDIARNKDNKKIISQIVSKTLACKIILMIISFFLLLLLLLLIPYLNDYSFIILCTFSIIPGSVLFTDWFFQAVEEMKYITVLNILSRFVFTILVFVVIREREDYYYQPLLTGVGFLIPSIISLWILRKRFKIKLYWVGLKVVLRELIKGWNLFVALFLPSIYSNLNTLILGSSNGQYAIGIYNGGVKFTSLAYSFFQLISRAVYPFFARRMNRHSLYVIISLLIGTLMSLVLFIFAEEIVYLFFGPEFKETIIVLKILSFTPIAMSLMNSYGFNYLVLKGRDKEMRNIMIIVTLFGVILGLYMAINYSFVGVAIVELLTHFLRDIMITFCALMIKTNDVV